MPRPHKPKIRSESKMTDAVVRHLKNKGKVSVWREVKLEGGRLDLVAYDKTAKVFKIVECKMHSSPRNAAQTFGQTAMYSSLLSKQVSKFLDAVSKRKPAMKYTRWIEATDGGKQIQVEFFVALSDKATRRPEFRNLREKFPEIGIFRIKPNGYCRNVLKRPDGTHDSKGAKALPQTIRL